MAENIRVGIIHCDLHSVYYGALIEDHDPLKLRSPRPPDYPKKTEWETGAGHFYHYTFYDDARRITVETVDGFEIVKCWDPDPERAQIFSEVFHDKPEVCDTLEQVSDNVDLVFVGDCSGNGSTHLEWARPGLEKGIATFVDKPFAYTVADVKQILELADANNTPVMSLSILRSLPDATLFSQRMPEIGGAQYGTVFGGFTDIAGVIHTVSLNQHIFGAGVERVKRVSNGQQTLIHLDYGDRSDRPRYGVTINCMIPLPHCALYASAYGSRGRIHSPHFDDYVFPFGAAENVKKIKQMVTTREVPVPRDEMIECVAIAEASRHSEHLNESVAVADVIAGKLAELPDDAG